MTSNPDAEPLGPSLASRIARLLGGGFGLVFVVGTGAGFLKAAREHGALSAFDFAVLAGLALAGAGAMWLGYTGLMGMGLGGPMAPSERKSRRLIWWSVGLGAVLALILGLGGSPQPGTSAMLDGPLSPFAVAVMIIGWIPALWISLKWHLTIDEHEQVAYNFGGIVSLYAYFTITICWWVLARGGFAPPIDAMATLFVVTFVWLGGWLWKRSR